MASLHLVYYGTGVKEGADPVPSSIVEFHLYWLSGTLVHRGTGMNKRIDPVIIQLQWTHSSITGWGLLIYL
ncbi:MAG: hypothetical protein CMF59_17630 [Leptospiraceae bacterium]|nr:hypothetical protein [Leptospiraceae bacterium]